MTPTNMVANATTVLATALFSMVAFSSEIIENLTGELSINNGSPSYTLPISVPAGVNGITPDLSVVYGKSSTATNMGSGFALQGVSSISRCSASIRKDGFFSGLEQSSNTRFCIGGTKLVAVDGVNGAAGTEYRAYNDNNYKYVSNGGSSYTPDSWTQYTPDGYVLTYSKPNRFDAKAAEWLLTSKADVFGNTISYEYSSDNESLLKKVTYSGVTINLTYEDRVHTISGYASGDSRNITKRLLDLSVSFEGKTAWSYDFSYENVGTIKQTERLHSVTKCYGNNDTGGCTKPLVFEYQEQPSNPMIHDTPEDQTIVIEKDVYATGGSLKAWERPSYTPADLNNDGFPEFCYYKVDAGIMCAEYSNGNYLTPQVWLSSSNFNYEGNQTDYLYFSQIRFADLNDDNYQDLCIADDGGIKCALNNKNSGFGSATYWNTQLNHESSFSLESLNHDGKPEFCGLKKDSDLYTCYSNSGTSANTQLLQFDDTVSHYYKIKWNEKISYPRGTGYYLNERESDVSYISPFWIDIDGDLDRDICWIDESKILNCKKASRNTSTKNLEFSSAVQWGTFPHLISMPTIVDGREYSISESEDIEKAAEKAVESSKTFKSAFRVTDLNGDALADVCYIDTTNEIKCRINDGTKLLSATSWSDLSGAEIYIDPDTQEFEEKSLQTALSSMVFQDTNFDGLPDMCIIYGDSRHCGMNTGSGFTTLQAVQSIASDIDFNSDEKGIYHNFVQEAFGSKTKYYYGVSSSSYGVPVYTNDLNGDGFSEFCYRSIRGVLCADMDNKAARTALVAVTDSFGKRTDIEYKPYLSGGLLDRSVPNQAGYNELLNNMQLVSAVVSDSGAFEGTTQIRNRIEYKYGPKLVRNTDNSNGFNHIVLSNPDRNFKTVSQLYLDPEYAGQEKVISEYINGVKVNEKTNQLNKVSTTWGTKQVRVVRSDDTQYDLEGTLFKTTSTTYTGFDGYGFAKTQTVTKNQAGETLTVTTETTYGHNETKWLLGKPSATKVTHADSYGSTEERTVEFVYTEQGALEKETIEPSSIDKQEIDYTYYANGLVETVSTTGSSKTRTVTKTYDSLGRLAKTTNELNQSSSLTYDGLCGVKTATDIAGKVTTTEYDLSCKKAKQYNSYDSNSVTWTIESVSSFYMNREKLTSTTLKNEPLYKITETHSSGPQSIVYYDAKGQELRKAGKAMSTGDTTRYSQLDIVYDQFGRPIAQSRPYFETNGQAATASWITRIYDSIDRLESETKAGPNGLPQTSSFSYTANTTTESYADYSKTVETGLHGKPSKITENGLIVEYKYDAIGNLVETDRDGQVTTLEYDDRGKKTKQIDPAMGTWEYDHNAFGELIWQKDAKAQEASYTYDELGRKKTETTVDGKTTWNYFESGNGIGQLESEVSTKDNVTRSFTYDAKGRLSTVTLAVDGKSFSTTHMYDDYSRLIETEYPDGMNIFQSYDNVGGMQSVSMPANDFNDFDYTAIREESDALINSIIELEANIMDLQRAADAHFAKMVEYQETANYFQGLYDKANGDIQALREAAEAFEEKGRALQLKADEMREKATEYREKLGGRVLTYQGMENGQYKFKKKWCAKRARRFGVVRCTRRKTEVVYFKPNNLNPKVDPSDSEEEDNPIHYFEQEPACITTIRPGNRWVPPKKSTTCTAVKPYQVYERAAAAFQDLADLEFRKAEAARDLINKPSDTQVLKPYEITYDSWVLIDVGGVLAPVPVVVTEMIKKWTTVSLAEAMAHYESQRDYYLGLAAKSETSYNGIIDNIGDLEEDLTEYKNAQAAFEDSLGMMDINMDDVDAIVEFRDQWQIDNKRLAIWMATARNESGVLRSELFGNGLYSARQFDDETGMLREIKTGTYSGTTLRHLKYDYNARGLVEQKYDDQTTGNDQMETFGYDQQGRLTSWRFDQTLTTGDFTKNKSHSRSYEYDDWGNLTTKTGSGTYSYNTDGSRLSSRTVNGTNHSYDYDNNGNFTNADGRTYTWNAFNKIESVSLNGQQVQYDYDGSKKRVVKRAGDVTTYYVSPTYEVTVQTIDGVERTSHRHNIWAENDVVATYVKYEQVSTEYDEYLSDQVAYYHRDLIGSGDLVTGSDMEIIDQRYYTPYGERIKDILGDDSDYLDAKDQLVVEIDEDYVQQVNDQLASSNAVTLLSEIQAIRSDFADSLRGYTSHEMVPEVGLINMNARHFDPVLARFVSADTMVPGIDQPLAYNRYAYVNGNPVQLRDPSGHMSWKPFAQAGLAVFMPAFTMAYLTDNENYQLVARVGLTVAITMALGPGTGAQFSALNAAWAAGAAATANLATTALITGRITNEDGRAAAWAGASAAVTMYVGHGAGIPNNWQRYVAHAITQGTLSHMQGGSFIQGAVSGLAGHAAGGAMKAAGFTSISQNGEVLFKQGMEFTFARTMTAAAFGWAAAQATGGDGVKAALTAATVHLFNSELDEAFVRAQKSVSLNEALSGAGTKDKAALATSVRRQLQHLQSQIRSNSPELMALANTYRPGSGDLWLIKVSSDIKAYIAILNIELGSYAELVAESASDVVVTSLARKAAGRAAESTAEILIEEYRASEATYTNFEPAYSFDRHGFEVNVYVY